MRSLFFSIVTMVFFIVGNAGAASIFDATVTSEGTTYSVATDNVTDIINEFDNTSIGSQIPAYSSSSAVTGVMNFRGIPMNMSYAANSTAMTMQIPATGLNITFTGTSREDSVELLKDWFKTAGCSATIKTPV